MTVGGVLWRWVNPAGSVRERISRPMKESDWDFFYSFKVIRNVKIRMGEFSQLCEREDEQRKQRSD